MGLILLGWSQARSDSLIIESYSDSDSDVFYSEESLLEIKDTHLVL